MGTVATDYGDRSPLHEDGKDIEVGNREVCR